MNRAEANDPVVDQRVAARNGLEAQDSQSTESIDAIDPDKYSKDQLTEMATETGELSTEILPELEFWDKVSKNGTFAAFQTALKQAKTLEERWRIVDKFPEIAKRSGMTESLAPRDSLKTIK